MKGIYLAAYKAQHNLPGLIYQDINGKRDIPGDMMTIDLEEYDYIIATPPCNYYSRANYRRETSEYSQKTKHLLPGILRKLVKQDKPFIVENVKSSKIFQELGLYDLPCFIYMVGRHTYWTNILMFSDIIQKPKIAWKNGKKLYLSSQNCNKKDREGTEEVHEVIEIWLKTIGAKQ